MRVWQALTNCPTALSMGHRAQESSSGVKSRGLVRPCGFGQGPYQFEPWFFYHEMSGVDGLPSEVFLRSELPQFLPDRLCGLSPVVSRDHVGQ